MSQLNCVSVASCSKFDPTHEDESQGIKCSPLHCIEAESPKLKFSPVFDGKINRSAKALLAVPHETLHLRWQHPFQQHIHFKSLPPLGARDSLENILQVHRYSEFPRRQLLRSFVKAASLEKRPRRRLCQNKPEAITRCNHLNSLTSQTCPEVNLQKLRHQFLKERKAFNRFDIGKFGKKIRNRVKGEAMQCQLVSTLHQGLTYEEVVSLCEDVVVNLEIPAAVPEVLKSSPYLYVKSLVPNLELQPRNRLTLHKSDSGIELLHSLEKLNLNDSENKITQNLGKSTTDSLGFTDHPREYDDKSGLEFKEKNEPKCDIVHFSKPTEDKNSRLMDEVACTSKVDFSSGDDSRNLCVNLMLDDSDHICKTTSVDTRQNLDLDFRRRSVQWNSEVDVIYYAGDIDGRKVVHREMEPLREEADQQARRNSFVKLALNKNQISALNTYKFLDPWVTLFQK